jgi:hypothetical protein
MTGRGKAALKFLFNESLGEGLLLHLTSIFTKWGLYKITSTVNHLIILTVYNHDTIMTLNKQNSCAVIINGRRKT